MTFGENVLAILLGALLAAIGALWRHERQRRVDVERQLSERKYGAYIALLNVFFDSFKADRRGKPLEETELVDRMIDVNKDLMIYGAEDVVTLYHKWTLEMRAGTVEIERLGDLVVAIRRDMGHPKTKISSEDVLRQLITDYDAAKARGELKQRIQGGRARPSAGRR